MHSLSHQQTSSVPIIPDQISRDTDLQGHPPGTRASQSPPVPISPAPACLRATLCVPPADNSTARPEPSPASRLPQTWSAGWIAPGILESLIPGRMIREIVSDHGQPFTVTGSQVGTEPGSLSAYGDVYISGGRGWLRRARIPEPHLRDRRCPATVRRGAHHDRRERRSDPAGTVRPGQRATRPRCLPTLSRYPASWVSTTNIRYLTALQAIPSPSMTSRSGTVNCLENG